VDKSAAASGPAAAVEDDDDSAAPVDYAEAFKKSGVSTVYNDLMDMSSSEVWRRCWKSKDHFE
jgi:hypothetical protein